MMTRKNLKKILFLFLKISLSFYTILETLVAKKKLSIEDFVSFCTGSRHITHNLMRAKTIHFRHFVVVVNTCNITLTFSVNDRYSFQPEQFLKNAVDVIYCPPCFGKCYIPLYKLRKSLVNI